MYVNKYFELLENSKAHAHKMIAFLMSNDIILFASDRDVTHVYGKIKKHVLLEQKLIVSDKRNP